MPAEHKSVPAEIRLIAAVSRLLDFHQSRREAGGAYVPEVPESAGPNLHLALTLLRCLHEIELDRGPTYSPVSELASKLRASLPDITDEDIERCILNLKHGREVHYGLRTDSANTAYGRTLDSTPLLQMHDGLSQVQLTENARLLLRIASMKESWLYSDLDADRLVKAIERGQFQDVPGFCRSMTLDVATKSKQLTNALEQPLLSDLRELLISEGTNIAESLRTAINTISNAIELMFGDHIQIQFGLWSAQRPGGADLHLGNLQADLELVLQNVESLSRRFLRFLEVAQKARFEGTPDIRFLELANHLVTHGSDVTIHRSEKLLNEVLTWGVGVSIFHPSFLVGQTDALTANEAHHARETTFTVDPAAPGAASRFMDFLHRNQAQVLDQLAQGPLRFSELAAINGLVLEEGESPLDFYGLYGSPNLIATERGTIVIGLTDARVQLAAAGKEAVGSDPIMYLRVNDAAN